MFDENLLDYFLILSFTFHMDKYRTNYYGCPDDDTYRFMASIYSHSHYNMSSSKEFPGGIVNGAFWYGNFNSAFLPIICSFHCVVSSSIILEETNCRQQVPHLWRHARLELYTCWLFRIDLRS